MELLCKPVDAFDNMATAQLWHRLWLNVSSFQGLIEENMVYAFMLQNCGKS